MPRIEPTTTVAGKPSLAYSLNRAWRLMATGISFSLFGVAGLFIGLLVFPTLFIVVREPRLRQKVARATAGWLFGAFIRIMAWLGVLDYSIDGLDDLSFDGSYLIVANHPTLIDVVFLVWLFPQSECVIKAAVIRNPFMKNVVLAANYISNDDPTVLIEECVNRLMQGQSLILFPEGTRSVPGKQRNLKLGAAAIAVRSQTVILPVTISCVPATLSKHEAWYEIPPRKPVFTIDVHHPVAVSDILTDATDSRVGTQIVNRYIARLFDDHSPV